ncbi:MAG TPA: ATP-binding cassette domain-containing protein [Anaerolineaceae bacterium]|nr:ATP-binding cassette domain-containing protein [Anaerolineaceae bacterium]HPN51427.1 ATP-binding cassette domain-containing protein [Anaerolineaceae bacterium]
MPEKMLEVKNLVKSYGSVPAVNDVSFYIETGEVFGLLGPNGAGKSTTISMITCLFPPTSGSITVLGRDVQKEANAVKKIIGVVPQDLALYPTLSARNNLRFFGEMYGLGGSELRARVESVLEYVAMTDRANDAVKTYSGGMKRRINLAAGLIHNPRILFLDEPTVGVDPQSRNHIFESVERLNREQGMSILYTTHYMEEAERLCNRIAIIDQGRIVAIDTPKNLIAMLGGGIIKIGLKGENEPLRAAIAGLPAVLSAAWLPVPEPEPGQINRAVLKVEARQANDALIQILNLVSEKDETLMSIETLEPNLESVFLHLTGKKLRE